MGKAKKNPIWMIVCFLVCVIFIPIIIFNIVLSVKSATDKDTLPSVLGYAPTSVLSGSMSPEFEKNDYIIIQTVSADVLNVGDVICYLKDGAFITHRISRIEVVDGIRNFYTKGDANQTEDVGFVTATNIQGKYVAKIPKFGGVVLFLQEPYGIILTVILLVMLYLTGELIIEYRQKKRDNKRLKRELAMLQKEPTAQVEQEQAVEALPVESLAVTATEYCSAQQNASLEELRAKSSNFIIINRDDMRLNYTAEKLNLDCPSIGVDVKVSFNESDVGEVIVNKKDFNMKCAGDNFTLLCPKAGININIGNNLNNTASQPQAPTTEAEESQAVATAVEQEEAESVEESFEQVSKDAPTDVQAQELTVEELTLSETEAIQPTNEEATANQTEPAKEEAPKNYGTYKRSFMSRLIQGGEDIQGLYARFKNHVLRYQDVKCKMSWGFEKFSNKRNPIAKLVIKGKSLFAYLALTEEEINNLKIDERVESSTRYEDFPAKIKITGIIKLNRAIGALDAICQRLNLTAGEVVNETYTYAYLSDKQLLKKGLIKEKN